MSGEINLFEKGDRQEISFTRIDNFVTIQTDPVSSIQLVKILIIHSNRENSLLINVLEFLFNFGMLFAPVNMKLKK